MVAAILARASRARGTGILGEACCLCGSQWRIDEWRWKIGVFDFDVLARLDSLKVGEMQQAIAGVDPLVRLVDVPAVMELLAADRLKRQESVRAISNMAWTMAALLNALSNTFSQDLERRDLELARMLAGEASKYARAGATLDGGEGSNVESPTGEFDVLLDKAIAHAAKCNLFSLATSLESLGEAHLIGVDEVRNWKTAFASGQRAAQDAALADVPHVQSPRPARGRPRLTSM